MLAARASPSQRRRRRRRICPDGEAVVKFCYARFVRGVCTALRNAFLARDQSLTSSPSVSSQPSAAFICVRYCARTCAGSFSYASCQNFVTKSLRMTQAFHWFRSKEVPHSARSAAKQPRHFLGAQSARFNLEALQFLVCWITVFHAGNIGTVACADKR